MPKYTSIPDMTLWSQSIGGLIINFGGLEFQTLRWLHVLGGEVAVVQAKGKGLSARIDAVLSFLSDSSVAAEDQFKARTLWQEAKDLAKIRNRIAHNPICLGRDQSTNAAQFSVIDLKRIAPSGENVLEPLVYTQIAEAALRARDINRALSRIVEDAES